MCSSLDELYQNVSPDQLTDDLGGTISFNNHEWIQHRAVSGTLLFYKVVFMK